MLATIRPSRTTSSPWLKWALAGLLLFGVMLIVGALAAHAQGVPLPKVTFGLEQSNKPQDVAFSLQVMILMTVLALAPTILVMMTAFTRIVIVLGFVRQAIGAQQAPPNQVLVGLAIFLTFFVMAPTFKQVNEDAVQPFLANRIKQDVAVERGLAPLRTFMFHQTRQKDLALYVHLAKETRPRRPADVPTYVLIPAFITSELKTAFTIGFIIYLPFLIIDMVIASTLMSMGMMMLPPTVISLPFKLILFVLVDGWHLLTRGLVTSFG
jgi:flagellar biosynthetic protein FliP